MVKPSRKEKDMWKLRCGNNETTVKFTNCIGRSQIRSFFNNNGSVLADNDRDAILFMEKGEILKFYFPDKVKFIEVIKEGE